MQYRAVRGLGMLAVAGVCLMGVTPLDAQTIKFSGYEWTVKSGEKMGPGPNRWDPANVRVDERGWLHLRIARKDGQWACAEVGMKERLGFGTYEFEIAGRIDRFDRNIVLGLFNYPTRDVGTDATNEIDIEFAHWGNTTYPPGNFTVWPALKGAPQTSHTFTFALQGEESTHRFTWLADRIRFTSLDGRPAAGTTATPGDDTKSVLADWEFRPEMPAERIGQRPMPVLINLWLFRGQPPTDEKEVEIVIKRFRFVPAKVDDKATR